MWQVVSIVAALAAATPVAALDGALAAYAAGDFRAAAVRLRPLAEEGSAIAETLLGVMAAEGKGGPADPATAVAWWLRAANSGYAPAQLALAKALASGRGVRADPGAAWIWARLAAAGGGSRAREAEALAARLQRGFSAERLAELEGKRAGWRPSS